METLIQELLEELLHRINSPFRKIRIEEIEKDSFRVNIESEEPSLLIGHHGENIYALQNILKTIIWSKNKENCNIILDVDDYRKRQEENVLALAERKVEAVRKTNKPQSLPPMAPYFRRMIHLHLAQDKYNDIETESVGAGDSRYLTIKPKSISEASIANEI
ncbi:MAG TPA: R3H domain-containing nucleic acid-binding protein [Candidatus Gracilibacteria bacterium]|nr:KH domain-containing protein [Candidatus Gracilibacteria bacterium]HRY91274.1 R3H domain-containing nucleic acid-binding protein [Candidatus Gracilibacteria bacterium]